MGINDVVVGPMRLSELRSKAASGAVHGESLVWRDGLEDWRPLRTIPELLAVIEEVASRRPSASGSVTAALGEGDPGLAGSRSMETLSASRASEFAAALPRRRGPGLSVYLAVFSALGLGLTVGFVFFGGERPVQTVVKYVEASARPSDGNSGVTIPGPRLSAAPAGSGENAAAAEGRVLHAAPRGPEKSGAVAGAAAPDRLESQALAALGAPGVEGPGEVAVRSNPGQPLDSGQVQRTVSRYTGSVKRSCWQPALDTRDADAPATARVVVTLEVGPDGRVTSAKTSPEPPGYRGLAACIAGRVRGWQFPVSGAITTINVPFVFAAQ